LLSLRQTSFLIKNLKAERSLAGDGTKSGDEKGPVDQDD